MVLLTLLTCWAGQGVCVTPWKEKLLVASSRVLESRTETKIPRPDRSAELLGSLPAGAESTGWSQGPSRQWKGDVGMS